MDKATKRQQYILRLLYAGHKVTTTTISQKLSVSHRTVARDIQHLRTVLAVIYLDIVFDSCTRSFVLAETKNPAEARLSHL
jgi:predicted DNA-binding transcriptional regulator YafY